MSILLLPVESVLAVAQSTYNPNDLLALSSTNKRLAEILRTVYPWKQFLERGSWSVEAIQQDNDNQTWLDLAREACLRATILRPSRSFQRAGALKPRHLWRSWVPLTSTKLLANILSVTSVIDSGHEFYSMTPDHPLFLSIPSFETLQIEDALKRSVVVLRYVYNDVSTGRLELIKDQRFNHALTRTILPPSAVNFTLEGDPQSVEVAMYTVHIALTMIRLMGQLVTLTPEVATRSWKMPNAKIPWTYWSQQSPYFTTGRLTEPLWDGLEPIQLIGYYSYYSPWTDDSTIHPDDGPTSFTMRRWQDENQPAVVRFEATGSDGRNNTSPFSLQGQYDQSGKFDFRKQYVAAWGWSYGGMISPWGIVGQWGDSLESPPEGEFYFWIDR